MFNLNDKVLIVDSMNESFIGKTAYITSIISKNPNTYTLNIGGGHWLSSSLIKHKKVNYNENKFTCDYCYTEKSIKERSIYIFNDDDESVACNLCEKKVNSQE